jgi:N-acetylglucosamine-6-phosphate deacetylase
MPAAVSPERPRSGITRLTGCRLVKGNTLVEEDLWLSSVTGRILLSQEVFYEHQAAPDEVIDLGGRIVCPGFIDVQFNGAFGFDFSQAPQDPISHRKSLKELNKRLIGTGLTSYLPTITSQKPELYQAALPYLGPSGAALSPTKNGIHSPEVLQSASSFADLEACYGTHNLSNIKKLTAAPEVGNMTSIIPEVVKHNIIFSIGHTEATYEEASAAVAAGAKMITHLFNAMKPLHHRNPGVFGILGHPSTHTPFFGVIADGIHLHPTTVKIAYAAHPEGMILVTDAMSLAGLPDGTYNWTNGDSIVKKGSNLTLDGTDKIAGGCATLLDCVNNFLNWSNASIPEAVRAVTVTPAKMLGLEGVKGCLGADADADLLVLSEEVDGEGKRLLVDQVWKFGRLVHERS